MSEPQLLRSVLKKIKSQSEDNHALALTLGYQPGQNNPNTYVNASNIVLTPDERFVYVLYLRRLGYVCALPEKLPFTDGINHVNFYSNGRTTVGKMISNFYAQPNGAKFDTIHGQFLTLEGYYHYLRIVDYLFYKGYGINALGRLETEYPDIRLLRTLTGAECIQRGRRLKASIYGGTDYRPGEFSDYANGAFQNALLRKLRLLKFDGSCLGNVLSYCHSMGLPFLHYYVMNGRVITPPHSEWLPNLVVSIVENIDFNDTTFDITSVSESMGLI